MNNDSSIKIKAIIATKYSRLDFLKITLSKIIDYINIREIYIGLDITEDDDNDSGDSDNILKEYTNRLSQDYIFNQILNIANRLNKKVYFSVYKDKSVAHIRARLLQLAYPNKITCKATTCKDTNGEYVFMLDDDILVNTSILDRMIKLSKIKNKQFDIITTSIIDPTNERGYSDYTDYLHSAFYSYNDRDSILYHLYMFNTKLVTYSTTNALWKVDTIFKYLQFMLEYPRNERMYDYKMSKEIAKTGKIITVGNISSKNDYVSIVAFWHLNTKKEEEWNTLSKDTKPIS